jgi:thioredoxin-related protein
MRKIIFPLIILSFTLPLLAQNNIESKREKFDPAKDPFKDLETAVVKAKSENKRILLDVGGEWCIWCHRLDAFIESSEEIKEFLNKNYITIKINFSPENKNEKFLSQYPAIKGYPHMFVLDSDGKFLHSQDTGLLEKEKSYDAEKILGFLKQWAPEKS